MSSYSSWYSLETYLKMSLPTFDQLVAYFNKEKNKNYRTYSWFISSPNKDFEFYSTSGTIYAGMLSLPEGTLREFYTEVTSKPLSTWTHVSKFPEGNSTNGRKVDDEMLDNLSYAMWIQAKQLFREERRPSRARAAPERITFARW